MRKIISILLAICWISATSAVYFEPCTGTGKGPLPKAVKAEDCDADSDRCDFFRGNNFKAFIDFTAQNDIAVLVPLVTIAVKGGAGELDMPLNRYDGCSWITEGAQQCPILKGKDSQWKLSIPVKLTDPLIPFTLQVEMFDQDDKSQFCFLLKGSVVI